MYTTWHEFLYILTIYSSDHRSPKYSQWYTAEEVIELFAPPRHAVDDIREWLQNSGIEAHRISESANKQWMQFDATAAEAADLLKTKFHVYEHLATGKKNIACDE